MNLKQLKKAETDFLRRFPGGFNDPEMLAIAKKHRMDKMVARTQEAFEKKNFARLPTVIDSLTEVVNKSSMVSLFEKPRFREFVGTLNKMDREVLADGLCERLHGNQQQGFEMMLGILASGKMAKWTLMTIVPTYYSPTQEVFVKPNTAKDIVKKLELTELVYKPAPSWEFYQIFRDQINEMKTKVDPNLSPSNAAFTGFLMMSL